MNKILISNYFVFDGDTAQVSSTRGEQFKTRAAWIDAPEIGHRDNPDAIAINQWQWGGASKEYLRLLLSGKHLLLVPIGDDQYGRKLAFWYASSKLPVRTSLVNCIQIQMIAAGMACDFLPYTGLEKLSNFQITLFCRILREQRNAYIRRKGFWSDPEFLRPSKYRELYSQQESH
ncbi:MAG: thermonuclease family protein [Thiotrichales bacterium]|nr:thermonuclease family protein [Thiotrichales bacterium]